MNLSKLTSVDSSVIGLIRAIFRAEYESVTHMVQDSRLLVGKTVGTASYFSREECVAKGIPYPDGGAAKYTVEEGNVVADGGSLINVMSGHVSQNIDGPLNVKTFGIKGDGSDEFVIILAIHDFVLAKGIDSYWPSGHYDSGIQNWPFRNQQTLNPSLKDYKGMTLRCGRNVTFSSNSVLGADVLQLNAIKNFNVEGYPTISGEVSGSAAGTNAVSITNGGENIYIEANPSSLGYVDGGSYLDGSKGFTLQNGSSATNDFRNIVMKGQVTNCGYGVEISLPYGEFDIGVSPIYTGIHIDVQAVDCWRGVSLGAAAAIANIPDANKDSDVTVVASLINCAQPLGMARWVRGKVKCHILNTKPKSALFRPLAVDQSVVGVDVRGDFRSNIEVKGTMLECDHKVIFGGIPQGGSIAGGSVGTRLDIELGAGSALISEFKIEDSGGTTSNNSTIKLASSTVSSPSDLLPLTLPSLGNQVHVDGVFEGQFTAAMSGGSAVVNGNVKWSLSEGVVSLNIPEIFVDSNSTFTTLSGIPLGIVPSTPQRSTILGLDNAINTMCSLIIEADGTATLYKDTSTDAGSWTASGQKGVFQNTVSYKLN